MKIENPTENYQTKDLYEAAFLYAKEIPLVNLEWNDNKCYFVFQDTVTSNKSLCKELSLRFWFGGDCLINAKSYYQAIQTLKNRIFAKV